ncbi:MAG: TetR family transcriptional regulator [Alphaproteobacteria bacterium]|nr:MAG: TetR family transcriptional regulator [Alphaproteobacteria bacterium]
MQSREKEILKVAEKMVRKGGYNAFSFREIADKVGIKSSSVHYHFPTKADLGAAVAFYYTENFLDRLGNLDELIKARKDPIKTYIKVFRDALTKDKHMCLCGLLGAEVNGLPPEVAGQVKIFFERNIEWLTQAYLLKNGTTAAKKAAMHTLALLEGSMILSNVLGDIKVFDKSIDSLA